MASQHDADVIVVGAGPAGSAAAYYLATAGLDVLLLDKATFPRDKVCGDGLTPRAVKELIAMGVDVSPSDQWARNKGLRVLGGGHRLEIDWPTMDTLPDFGLAAPRGQFDDLLVRHAQKAGARFQQATAVTHLTVNDRTGRVTGVGTKDGEGRTRELTARLVVAADGVSSRTATQVGRERAQNRPMGVAIRTYFRSPRADDEYMESHLELWDGKPGESTLMPGYGWVFPLPGGLVNVGLGSVSSTASGTKLDYRDLLAKWVAASDPEWEFTQATEVGKPRSAALPMAFNRKPHYAHGLLLAGDAGGMVSPFNGEGIAYALQAGRLIGGIVPQALARSTPYARERALRQYPQALERDLGGYFSLGRVFVTLIEHPQVMYVCTRYGLPRPTLMRFTMKLLAHMYEPRGGDWMDRLISTLARLAPAA